MFEEIIREADRLNLDVHIMRHSERYMHDTRWSVEFTARGDGATVKASANGTDCTAALSEAWEKFSRTLTRGIPQAMLMPPVEVKDINPDIPY